MVSQAQSELFTNSNSSASARRMAQANLEQSQAVVGGLLATLLAQIRPPLIVSRLEGDAVFCYAPDGSFLQGQTMLEVIDSLYYSFRQAMELEDQNTDCDCQACGLRPSLDLKIIVHYGQYGLERIGRSDELHGPDVIIAHRLLKNHVRERTGLQAYALVTEAAAVALRLGALVDDMATHTETYEHLGEVRGYLYDLSRAWERERAGRRVVVGPDAELWFTASVDLPVPPLAWDYVHAPEKKREWMRLEALAVSGQRQGRVGPGTIHHCVHGRQAWQDYYVDWQPFDYATAEYALPLGGTGRLTMSLTPIPSGTRVSVRAERPSGPGLRGLPVRVLSYWNKRRLEGAWRARLQSLQALVTADQAARSLAAPHLELADQ